MKKNRKAKKLPAKRRSPTVVVWRMRNGRPHFLGVTSRGRARSLFNGRGWQTTPLPTIDHEVWDEYFENALQEDPR
jgi:hypothetical protein